jgi:hypothetical protein
MLAAERLSFHTRARRQAGASASTNALVPTRGREDLSRVSHVSPDSRSVCSARKTPDGARLAAGNDDYEVARNESGKPAGVLDRNADVLARLPKPRAVVDVASICVPKVGLPIVRSPRLRGTCGRRRPVHDIERRDEHSLQSRGGGSRRLEISMGAGDEQRSGFDAVGGGLRRSWLFECRECEGRGDREHARASHRSSLRSSADWVHWAGAIASRMLDAATAALRIIRAPASTARWSRINCPGFDPGEIVTSTKQFR